MFHKLFELISKFLNSCIVVIIGFLVIATLVTIVLAICNGFGWHVAFLSNMGRWFYTILHAILNWMHGQI